MTEDEKKAFLKRMGYSGSCLRSEVISAEDAEKAKAKEKKKSNLVDKDELLHLKKIFDQK